MDSIAHSQKRDKGSIRVGVNIVSENRTVITTSHLCARPTVGTALSATTVYNSCRPRGAGKEIIWYKMREKGPYVVYGGSNRCIMLIIRCVERSMYYRV